MSTREETLQHLAGIPDLQVSRDVPLAGYTRFGIGGPADILAEAFTMEAFVEALDLARESGLLYMVIGGGTNLIVSDAGFRGIVLKLSDSTVQVVSGAVTVGAGTTLQTVVDTTVDAGLSGLQTLTGIPGTIGAAVYGNAGAYGHSISEVVTSVDFYDGEEIQRFTNAECQFRYRESIFKQRKDWIVLRIGLALREGDAAELRTKADGILAIRNEKYPPTMKCAGSIFKNYLLAELPPSVAEALPPSVIREGKVPSAYFLEQVGAKGMSVGDIHVATYHANLIYNAGHGTAEQLVALIEELKRRIWERFGIPLEEEVQYVGSFLEPSPVNP